MLEQDFNCIKIMTEKKEVKSAPKAAKKATTKKAPAKKAVAAVAINAENVGFKAGDVYNALAAEAKALTVAEIAKVQRSALRRFILVLVGSSKRARLRMKKERLLLLKSE